MFVLLYVVYSMNEVVSAICFFLAQGSCLSARRFLLRHAGRQQESWSFHILGLRSLRLPRDVVGHRGMRWCTKVVHLFCACSAARRRDAGTQSSRARLVRLGTRRSCSALPMV